MQQLTTKVYPRSLGSSSIATQTMINANSYFEHCTRHRPTPAMMSALKCAAQVIEDMANRACPSSFFLSSVDPGVGKTTVLEQSLYSILYSPEHRDVSVLVCVSRLSEIRKIVDQSELKDSMFAAFTSDEEINALGRGKEDAGNARVLFTTQQMINSKCDGKLFKDATEFHFKGNKRDVRVWDEQYLPGETLTLNRSLLMKLAAEWTTRYPELGNLVDTLATELRGTSDGDTVSIPDFAATIGATKEAMLETLPERSRDADFLYQGATKLWLLSGKAVAVRKDTSKAHGQTQTVLSYRDHLPEDFAPVLILDASGRVRKTYDQWEASDRNNLVKLSVAKKTYRNLTIHAWQRGGGKSSFRNRANYEEILQGICNTIDKKPDEKFLVVHHKAEKGVFDVEKDVMGLIDRNRTGSVSFTSWGNHKASNEWSDVPNVILAGTLFFPRSQYEALGRMSSNLLPGRPFPTDSFNETCRGEHMDGILQAGCRAAIRCSVNGDCPPSNLYIIASKASGIPKTLEEVFPGHQQRLWRPVKRTLSGKVRQTFTYLSELFQRNPNCFIKFTTVAERLGSMDRRDFNKRIRQHPEFITTIAEAGIIETSNTNSRRPNGFMLADVALGFTREAA